MVQRIFKLCQNFKYIAYHQKVSFSRKSSSNQEGRYRIVDRGSDNGGDGPHNQLGSHSNWELLAPQGYRFYLPGGIGPAWHDEVSVSFMPSTISGFDGTELECSIQECPFVLRQGIDELFPGSDSNQNQLTVVSLSQKKENKSSDADIEKLTKKFMWAAQDICVKLKKAGYWADFINPFSGMPFGSSYSVAGLYQTDERFRCLGFHITMKNSCRIVTNKINNKFIGTTINIQRIKLHLGRTKRSLIRYSHCVMNNQEKIKGLNLNNEYGAARIIPFVEGSLFTNAPPSTALLRDILKEYE